MNWCVFWTIFAIGEIHVLLQGSLAWEDGLLTPRQMVGHHICGLPFAAHEGMWSDSFIITPLVAAIIGYYGPMWSLKRIMVAVAVGFVLTFFMHETYKKIKWQEAHVKNGRLTDIGWMHFFYMWPAFTALYLYFFRAMSPSEFLTVCFVSILLIIHVSLANHVVLGWVKPSWYPGEPLKSFGTWAAIVGTFLFLFCRLDWLMAVGW